ncbi:MAG: hypothetical protein J6A59_05320 [Lachnospiraceae bacterium]|nr:hypothetical protein [Lachnospiraceae bacterium]
MAVSKNTIQAKCIEKFRDKQNRIYGYRLIDLNGQTQDVTSDNLKNAIANGRIHVVNLTLSKDGRLMDTSEKQLQSKSLGKAPVIAANDYSNVAKAFVLIEKELLDMGDSYEEIVSCRTSDATGEYLDVYDMKQYYTNPEFSDCNEDKSKILDKLLYKAYLYALKNNVSMISDTLEGFETFGCYDRIESVIQYENASSINESKIYKALCIIYKYAKEHKLPKDVIEPLYRLLNKLKGTSIESINIGYNIGNIYYKYLNSELFGTISNDVFTVGNTITEYDIKEHKEYKGYNYVLHKDINKCGAPRISIAALFKNDDDNGRVRVDIKIGRYKCKTPDGGCVGIAGHILNVESFTLANDESKMEDYAKAIASKFNRLAPKLYDLADVHQSLYSNLGYEKSLEVVSLDDLNSHGRLSGKELVDLTLSRWTKIRGHRLTAKTDKVLYNSDTSFHVLYKNNISDNGNDRRLYIKYNGKELTLKVLDGGDINKVVSEKTEEVTGSIVDNSSKLAELMVRTMIAVDAWRM